ncbi:MAG: hypothetical protein APR63_05470 [Desulfuromonas sp. SDB]|nr:MAG: hypothetical protein APR63_05470 [Desulfuromonas sp. SDB]
MFSNFKFNRRGKTALALLWIFLVNSFPLYSQYQGPPDREPFRNLEAIKLWKMAEYLELDQEQMGIIITVHREFTSRTSFLQETRRILVEDLRERIENEYPDDQLLSAVDSIINIDNQLFRLRQEERDEIFEIFSPVQQAKFFIFQIEFARQVREHLQQLTPPSPPDHR